MRKIAVLGLAAFGAGFVAGYLPGQSSETLPTFEVVSIKPTPPPSDGNWRRAGVSIRGGPGSSVPGRVTGHNVSLFNILVRAYEIGLTSDVIGPAWIAREPRYDFVAKVPGGSVKEQVPLMLQSMLRERFGLTVHYETRHLPVYRLVVARSGSKLKPWHAARDAGSNAAIDGEGFPVGQDQTRTVISNGYPHMQAVRWTMGTLTTWLSGQIDHPVTDATGLTDEYNFRLAWTPGTEGPGAQGLLKAAAPGDSPASGPEGPDIFEAVREQLGLRLVPGGGPVRVLVIDHIDKTPTGN